MAAMRSPKLSCTARACCSASSSAGWISPSTCSCSACRSCPAACRRPVTWSRAASVSVASWCAPSRKPCTAPSRRCRRSWAEARSAAAWASTCAYCASTCPRAASMAAWTRSPCAMVCATVSCSVSMCCWSWAAARSRVATALSSEGDADHAGGLADGVQRADQRLGQLLDLVEQRLQQLARELGALLRVGHLLLEVVERAEDAIHRRADELLDLALDAL